MHKDNPFKVDLTSAQKDNIFYSLAMFPYPSGAGLHVGHAMNFTANDIMARFKRMQGYSVLNPIGWDSFGLPTEGYAMKVGKQAQEVTQENVASFINQCKMMDWSYDWDRELATSSPEYYKWTQWIFQQLFKAGLVYRKEAFVNWCPFDQTVLANDQVVDGKCERCSTEVVQKKHMQWFIKITDYAERLITDLDTVDWPEETKTQQKYWIGKSEGAEIDFPVAIARNDIASASNVVVLHGIHDEARKGWRGWFADECEKRGIECYSPQCNHENGIILEKDLETIITQCGDKINENTIIVGYSLGGLTAKHLITKLNKKVKKLITVASSFSRTPEGDDLKEPDVVEYRNAQTDDNKIDELVGEHIAYFSKDDPAIPYEKAVRYFEAHYPKCHIKTFNNKGHFNKHFGVNQIEELLVDARLEHPTTTITVFTTRPDTIYGVTAIVLAPENETIDGLLDEENKKKLEEYRKATGKKTNLERQQDAEEKSGMFSGISAIHPLTNEQIPVWFADYVLPDYATGAVMFVPAHDERDYAFAKKHGLAMKQVIASYYPALIGEYQLRPDQEITRRNVAMIIVKHPTEDKYVILKHNNMPGSGFPTGGIDGDEDLVQAAMREAQEELGYKNYTHISSFNNFQVHSSFFAPHKNLNRYITQYGVLLQLVDEEKEEVQKDEHDDFDILWVERKDVLSYLTYGNQQFFWNQYLQSGAITGEGKIIHSAEFDGLDNVEAKKAIIEHLEKSGLGKRKITFKLRDWSVSRQRYWGSPIPFYYTFAENEQVPFFMYTEGNKAFRPGAAITPRQVIQCVVKDKNSDNYCFVKRTHDNDVSTFFGGIDDKEDAIVAAKRELLEEGGFADAEFIKEIGEYHVQFYHPTKERNQYSINHLLYFEVDRAKQSEPTDPEAKALHVPVWMTAEEFLAVTKNDTSVHAMHWLTTGNPLFEKRTERYNAYNPHPDTSKWIPNLIPEDELPVILPLDVANYKPAGKSPLADHPTFPHYSPSNKKVPYFRYADEVWGVREGVETKKRTVVQAIIKDKNSDKYLMLKWKIDGTLGFVIGGVERGEDHIEALKREIAEEAGFENVKVQYQIGGESHRHLYHALKGHNQYTDAYCYYVEVDKADQQKIAAEELEKHEPVWLTKEEILRDQTDPDIPYQLELLENPNAKAPAEIDRFNEYNPQPTYLRECDTLDTFMCSSFYYIRFADPQNEKELVSKELADKTLPVDFYIGGREHTYGHLLYSRFIHKFLFDQGYLPSAEPFQKLIHQGFVLGSDGRKMSKRWGNVINPSEVVEEFGSDTTRTYTMFMGPLEQEKIWNPSALSGVKKFIERVERLEQFVKDGATELDAILHKTIKGVQEDIEKIKFNTAVSKLMVFVNEVYDKKAISKQQLSIFLQLLAPFATRLTQEMWERYGNEGNIHFSKWPTFDPAKIAEDTINMPIQLGGKMKGTLEIPAGSSESDVMAKIQADERFAGLLEGKEIVKVIYVQDKIINIIAK